LHLDDLRLVFFLGPVHRGVEFTVVATPEPNVWRWQFRIGDKVMTGKTEAKLFGLASRRAQLAINRALRREDLKITRAVTKETWPKATLPD
jgi:hypothetical protein